MAFPFVTLLLQEAEYDRHSLNPSYFNLQVATTLLVVGFTLTLWIPGQTVFASTSSY